MRFALFATLSLLLTLGLAAPAAATHTTCGSYDRTVAGLVDVWFVNCIGVGLGDAWAACTTINVLHVEALDLASVAVFHNCQTGVWLLV